MIIKTVTSEQQNTMKKIVGTYKRITQNIIK